MDLRIVNTCNNDCLFCLEQELRDKKEFISLSEILKILESEQQRDILCFYGGNPLLHPELVEILVAAKNLGYKNISLLTNTYTITTDYMYLLKSVGLNTIHFYFHSFDEQVHARIVNGGISLRDMLKNITILQSSWLAWRAIFHVNKQNYLTIHRDVWVLFQKFWIRQFECINYLPVSRAFEKYNVLLEYDQAKIVQAKLSYISTKYNIELTFIRF